MARSPTTGRRSKPRATPRRSAQSSRSYGRPELSKRCREEREGFEPSVPFGTHDFQSCPFGHSGTSPVFSEERVGVEPTLDSRPNLISNQALSATQPPLRIRPDRLSPRPRAVDRNRLGPAKPTASTRAVKSTYDGAPWGLVVARSGWACARGRPGRRIGLRRAPPG